MPYFTSTNQTLYNITLTWGKPETNCEIGSYYIYWSGEDASYEDSFYDTDHTIIDGNETETVVENLYPNYYYKFEIYAANSEGEYGPAKYCSQYTDSEFIIVLKYL